VRRSLFAEGESEAVIEACMRSQGTPCNQ
jgi:hypothetical protein